MSIQRKLLAAIALLVTVTACDSRSPTAPGNPPPRVTVGGNPRPDWPPVFAEISIRSISHEPGATLRLRECDEAHDGGRQLCTDELQAVFDVAADRDMASVALRLTFSQEGQRCGFAITPPTSLSAHVAGQMRATLINYHVKVDEPNRPADLGCDFPPLTTTTMTVDLMDYSEVPAGEPVFTKQFSHGYRFAIP